MKKMIAFRIDTDLLARVFKFMDKTGDTKTAVIERALEREIKPRRGK